MPWQKLSWVFQVFADIMDNFASVCELLGVQPGNFTHFYPDLKVSKEWR